jgi:hypothetical protein
LDDAVLDAVRVNAAVGDRWSGGHGNCAWRRLRERAAGRAVNSGGSVIDWNLSCKRQHAATRCAKKTR